MIRGREAVGRADNRAAIVSVRSFARVCLLTNPSAPVMRRRSATSVVSCIDRIRILLSGEAARISFAAFVPLITGIAKSSSTKWLQYKSLFNRFQPVRRFAANLPAITQKSGQSRSYQIVIVNDEHVRTRLTFSVRHNGLTVGYPTVEDNTGVLVGWEPQRFYGITLWLVFPPASFEGNYWRPIRLCAQALIFEWPNVPTFVHTVVAAV